jgi:hypothetical protein
MLDLTVVNLFVDLELRWVSTDHSESHECFVEHVLMDVSLVVVLLLIDHGGLKLVVEKTVPIVACLQQVVDASQFA